MAFKDNTYRKTSNRSPRLLLEQFTSALSCIILKLHSCD